MKKINKLLLVFLVLITITSCNENIKKVENSYSVDDEMKSRTMSIHDYSINDAIYTTTRKLYNIPSISTKIVGYMNQFYGGIINGSILSPNIDPDSIPKDNKLIEAPKHSGIAGFVFQKLFRDIKNAPEVEGDKLILKDMLNYNLLNTSNIFEETLSSMNPNHYDYQFIQNFIKGLNQFIIPHQDLIIGISKEYEKLLLDSSSSASKSASGAGVLTSNKYEVSANIVYAISKIIMDFEIDLNNRIGENKEKILADIMYNLSQETKLKITYNKSLLIFDEKDTIRSLRYLIQAIEKNISQNQPIPEFLRQEFYDTKKFIKNVIEDIIKHDVAGDKPYPNNYKLNNGVDSVIKYIEEYKEGSADNQIIYAVANKILGSPTGKSLILGKDYKVLTPTDSALENIKYIYKKFKAHGLKAPKTIYDIGINNLSTLIADFLTSQKIAYISVNSSNQAYIPEGNLKAYVDKFFTNAKKEEFTSNGLPTYRNKVCSFIHHYNEAIDSAAVANVNNTGYFDLSASGEYCDIYINSNLYSTDVSIQIK